jgi:hypothetical protein
MTIYIPKHNVELIRSNVTGMLSRTCRRHICYFSHIISATDLWAIQYLTNLSSIEARVLPPVAGPPLGTQVSEISLKYS